MRPFNANNFLNTSNQIKNAARCLFTVLSIPRGAAFKAASPALIKRRKVSATGINIKQFPVSGMEKLVGTAHAAWRLNLVILINSAVLTFQIAHLSLKEVVLNDVAA